MAMKVPKVPPPCTITLPTPWISSLPEKNLVKKSCTCSAYIAIDVSFMLGQVWEEAKAGLLLDRYILILLCLSTSHSHSERSKATKYAARGHANTHAHHEAHLHPVKAGWLPSSMHCSLWHRHAGLERSYYLKFQNLFWATFPIGDFICTSIDAALLEVGKKWKNNLTNCLRRLQIFREKPRGVVPVHVEHHPPLLDIGDWTYYKSSPFAQVDISDIIILS